MYSFTIAAVVLVTGLSNTDGNSNVGINAEFKYIKSDLKFETLEECKAARRGARVLALTGNASHVQGFVEVTECEEVR